MYSVSLYLCKSLHAHSSLLSRNLIFACNCLFSVANFMLSLINLSVSTSTNNPSASLHVVEYFLASMFNHLASGRSHFLYNHQNIQGVHKSRMLSITSKYRSQSPVFATKLSCGASPAYFSSHLFLPFPLCHTIFLFLNFIPTEPTAKVPP